MVVFLLVLIVLILLFGAGAVLGVLRGAVLNIALLLTLFYGLLGVAYILNVGVETVFFVVTGALLLLAAIVAATKTKPTEDRPLPTLKSETPFHVREAIDRDRKLTEEFKAKIENSRGQRPR